MTSLIQTAGGSISEVFRDTIHNLCYNANSLDGNERSDFRGSVLPSFSYALLIPWPSTAEVLGTKPRTHRPRGRGKGYGFHGVVWLRVVSYFEGMVMTIRL